VPKSATEPDMTNVTTVHPDECATGCTVVTFVISGSVADFGTTQQTAFIDAFATFAGVSASVMYIQSIVAASLSIQESKAFWRVLGVGSIKVFKTLVWPKGRFTLDALRFRRSLA